MSSALAVEESSPCDEAGREPEFAAGTSRSPPLALLLWLRACPREPSRELCLRVACESGVARVLLPVLPALLIPLALVLALVLPPVTLRRGVCLEPPCEP